AGPRRIVSLGRSGSPDPSLRRVFPDVPEYVADDVDVGLGGHPVVEGEANRSLALPAGRARVDAAIRLKGIEELTVASVVLVVVPRRVGVPGADDDEWRLPHALRVHQLQPRLLVDPASQPGCIGDTPLDEISIPLTSETAQCAPRRKRTEPAGHLRGVVIDIPATGTRQVGCA